jgi:hypothetical protein
VGDVGEERVKESSNDSPHKFDNVDEMDQFLENYKLFKPTHHELGNLNSPMIILKLN